MTYFCWSADQKNRSLVPSTGNISFKCLASNIVSIVINFGRIVCNNCKIKNKEDTCMPTNASNTAI